MPLWRNAASGWSSAAPVRSESTTRCSQNLGASQAKILGRLGEAIESPSNARLIHLLPHTFRQAETEVTCWRKEISAYVPRQTRRSHSGGRRFEPDQLHQLPQSLTTSSSNGEGVRVSILASSLPISLRDFSITYEAYDNTNSGSRRFGCVGQAGSKGARCRSSPRPCRPLGK